MSPKPVQAPRFEEMETAALVDLLGPIEEELDRVSALMDPAERKAKAIRVVLSKRVDVPDATILRGKQYFSNVGEKNNQTTPHCVKIFRLLGKAEFLAHCEFGVEKLKVLLPLEWRSCISEDRTGSRKVVTQKYPATAGVQSSA